MKRKQNHRRKAFLLESNLKKRNKPKILRNRFLSIFMRITFLRQLLQALRISTIGILLLVGMFFFIVFALFSPYFQLKRINIIRDSPSLDIERIQTKLDSFYGQNLFRVKQETIRVLLMKEFPEFRKVKIEEQWPDQIKITIELSPPAFSLLNKETANFSTISEDGIVLNQSPTADLPLIAVKGYEKLIVPRMPFITRAYLEKIKEARYIVQESLKLNIEEVIYIPIAKELHIELIQGTSLWLDLELDIPSQLRKLELASSKIKLNQNRLEHVDLRIPDHLYWKEKPGY